MDEQEKRCLICQGPLPGQNQAYCSKECQRESRRRVKAYYAKYGHPAPGQKEGMATKVHPKWELQLPGYWIHNHVEG